MKGPSAKMRRRAAGWMTDQITLATQSATVATRANMANGATTTGTGVTYDALIRQETVIDADDPTRTRAERNLKVWIDQSAPVVAGQQMTVTAAGDSSLVGAVATVELVERDSHAAIRRFYARLASDA